MKILLIDDDTLVRDTIQAILETVSDMEISSVESAIEGLELTTRMKFDLVITDINMSVMNGFEFLKRFYSVVDNKNIPVVVLSASFHGDTRDRCRKLGAKGLIAKPFNMDQLLNLVGNFA